MFLQRYVIKRVTTRLWYAEGPYWRTFGGIGSRAKALGPILPKVCQYGPLAYHSRVITYYYTKSASLILMTYPDNLLLSMFHFHTQLVWGRGCFQSTWTYAWLRRCSCCREPRWVRLGVADILETCKWVGFKNYFYCY